MTNPTQTPTPTEPGLKPPWSIDSDASDAIDSAKTTFARELLDKALEHALSVGRKYNGAPLITLADVQAALAATPAPAAPVEAAAREKFETWLCKEAFGDGLYGTELKVGLGEIADKAVEIFSPPAPEGELPRVKGPARIEGVEGTWYISREVLGGHEYLWSDGEWHSSCHQGYFTHRRDAEKILAAAQPVSPAATAEQGDESEAIKWLGNVIERLAALKDEAVANQNFERACAFRDAYVILRDEAKAQPSAPAQEEGQSDVVVAGRKAARQTRSKSVSRPHRRGANKGVRAK